MILEIGQSTTVTSFCNFRVLTRNTIVAFNGSVTPTGCGFGPIAQFCLRAPNLSDIKHNRVILITSNPLSDRRRAFMSRISILVLMGLVFTMGYAREASADPQILAALSMGGPLELVCHDTICEAELSAADSD